MTYRWANEESNFYLRKVFQGNQSSWFIENYHQKFNSRAYLNPQIVNYELIKKSLINSCLQSSGKIHINPNFRGKSLSNITINDYPQLVDMVQLDSQRSSLCRPEISKTLNACDGKKIANEILADDKSELNYVTAATTTTTTATTTTTTTTTTTLCQSRFKKINDVNMKSCTKSRYSWFKNRGVKTNLNTYSKNIIATSGAKVENEKSKKAFNCIKNIYKYAPLKKAVPQIGQTSKICSIYKSETKIINESKTVLINNAYSKTKLHFKDRRIHIPVKKNLNLSKFVYNKNNSSNNKSSVLMIAKAVRSKYKYLSNLEHHRKSKYKIDKRNKLSEAMKNKSSKIKDIRKLFPNYFYNKVKLCYKIQNIEKCCIASKSNCSWSKNQLSDKNIKEIINQIPNRKVVNIGGILYKSTANKLTLANKEIKSNSKKSVINKSKGKKNHIVYVRGEKFILENNGKALRRKSANTTNEKTPLFIQKRIDIGGVTYLQKSCNVLIRTNVHQARLLVNKAKNKSIALLTNLHKRSSMPCMIYHRFGRCIRHTKSLCMYKHDPKNIAVCKKFLKGNCTDHNCLLSHQVIQEKMATCHFFLKGLCIRENCPFLHVKLNKNAAICENFLQGFCNLGKECSKRHLHQCPEFDKYGTCKLGSLCHYPHKKTNKVEKNSEKKTTESLYENSNKPEDKTEVLQYFIKSNNHTKHKKTKSSGSRLKEITNMKIQKKITKKKSLFINNSGQSDDTIECFPKRIKLDKLPCFIPLASTSDFKQSEFCSLE